MNAIKVWALRAFAALGVTGLVVVSLGLVFWGGEIRELFRKPGAPPGTPVVLEDAPAAEDTASHVAGPCETGQGLRVLDPEPGERVKWEEKFGRDLDGDGRVGELAPAPAPEQLSVNPPAGFLSLGSPTQVGELVFARKALSAADAGARGGEILGTAPATGGELTLTWVANPVPDFEWIHELRFRGELELPVGAKSFAEQWAGEADWFPARWRIAYLGLQGYVDERGGELDRGVRALVEIRCRGWGDCEAK